MSPEPGLTFDQLAEIRRELVQDVRPHRDSINFFATTIGFARTADQVVAQPASTEPPAIEPLANGTAPAGITTALTCFESLHSAILNEGKSDPAAFAGLTSSDTARVRQFCENALAHPGEWKSENSARRYCIVRALPPVLQLFHAADRSKETALLREVWDLVDLKPESCGVFELAPQIPEHNEPATPYPPNAFLTYWALKAARLLGLSEPDDIRTRSSINLWLRGVIGRELALHSQDNRRADPQQLAWAIASLVAESESALADHPDATSALIEAGLDSFFAQQSASGTWDTGRPLFHYLRAGNAYCYIYETLAELIDLGLQPEHSASVEVRRLLVRHLPELLRAREHLLSTARPLGDERNGLLGWSSGHHPHRTAPESWATATAFRFLQGLRRLVGLEVRDQAAATLQARRARHDEETLIDRGKTWDSGRGQIGTILLNGLVRPVTAANARADGYLDPDRPRIPKSVPRSAILYGPPGTGKTTLAESVAASIGWRFVEVTSADFLSEGSDQVSARADEIFRQLMELDEVVVLFDEVDELIRSRSRPGEMAGRFFTTTMLPRLARLWERRRTVFFLNTNGIRNVDPAVQRSQRFDAALLVLPPSFDKKLEMLHESVRDYFDLERITKLLDDYVDKSDDFSASEAQEAWLTFLTFDQLKLIKGGEGMSKEDLYAKLTEFGRELPPDWELASEEKSGDALKTDVLKLQYVIKAYNEERAHQRLDSTFLAQLDAAQG
ncbi:MAG TPA: AAA family ATPase [Acidimicrobiales bacterium]|nr:AAA family ATPase [Acidimicrobiales bacterium]